MDSNNHFGALQTTVEHRIFLQRNQNTSKNQVIHRNEHECCISTDLDSTDYHTTIKDAPKGGEIQMAPLQFSVFHKAQPICKNRSEKMA